MNYYEILYIINSSLDENAITNLKKEIEEFITSEGGDIYNRADWGRTRLAYEIEKQRYGNYVLIRFASKSEVIRVLRDKMELMDMILSYLVIVLEDEPERIEEEAKKGAEEKPFKKEEEPVKE